eukprot:TRINITY_DN1701_c3_g1_i1.p2 TRINITY_DN1701_c3_g1~~TRINITY_DN1701_c3_g1_i1.p2  ORF type:complete len:160 (-),score=43.57 TRINITY_DN1701_c3_g1_i1:2-436(-)
MEWLRRTWHEMVGRVAAARQEARDREVAAEMQRGEVLRAAARAAHAHPAVFFFNTAFAPSPPLAPAGVFWLDGAGGAVGGGGGGGAGGGEPWLVGVRDVLARMQGAAAGWGDFAPEQHPADPAHVRMLPTHTFVGNSRTPRTLR